MLSLPPGGGVCDFGMFRTKKGEPHGAAAQRGSQMAWAIGSLFFQNTIDKEKKQQENLGKTNEIIQNAHAANLRL